METENDKRSRNIGLIASVCFHGGIALLLFMLVAWKAPNPPNPEYGVEINLGFTDTGDGDIQPQTEVGNDGASEESATQPQEAQPQQEIKEEITEQQEEVVTDESNPVSVKEEKKEATKETPKEVKPVPKEEKKIVNEEAVFNPKETTDKTTAQKKGENLSQGNDKNTTGDKGQSVGTLDPRAEYTGVQGGGYNEIGYSLQLKGWRWEKLPNPVFSGNERGVIVYTIEVDDNGEIIGLKPDIILSPETDRICREEIRKLSLKPDGSGTSAGAKGKITFVVKAQ